MDIRIASQEDMTDIVAILDAATKKLLDKKIYQWTLPWEQSLIEREIALGYQYLARIDGSVAAVFSIREIDGNSWEREGPDRALYLYRIAVSPHYQGTGTGRALCEWAQNHSLGRKMRLYLDCWAGNEKLRAFYAQAGFHSVGDFPEEDYMITVFRYPR